MKRTYDVFFVLLLGMSVLLIVGMLVGKRGGPFPTILGALFGLLFIFLLLYSFDWLPTGKKNKNHP